MQSWHVLFKDMFTFSVGLKRVFVLGVVLAQMGCAAHLKGLFENGGSTKYLLYDNDKRLVVRGDSDAPGLMRLDGCLVEVWGQKQWGKLRVDSYKILEGTHGLAHWTGHLAWRGGVLGLVDLEGSSHPERDVRPYPWVNGPTNHAEAPKPAVFYASVNAPRLHW